MKTKLTDRLQQQARLMARVMDRILPETDRQDGLDDYCRELGALPGLRISVIRSDGAMVCDSDRPAAAAGNHLNRPEVRQALHDGTGEAMRFSESAQTTMFHAAVFSPEKKRIIRVAVALAEARKFKNEVMMLLGTFLFLAPLLAIVVSFIFARYLTRIGRASGPSAEG